MVKKRLGNLGIFLRAVHDQSRVGFHPGNPEHGSQQSCFVAADTGALVKGHAYRMGFISRRILFHRKPQVADFLGNPCKYRLNLLAGFIYPPDQLGHLGPHGRGNLFKIGFTKVPVPSGDRLPILDCADQKALHLGVKGRHIRLWNSQWNVFGDPFIDDEISLFTLFKRYGTWNLGF